LRGEGAGTAGPASYQLTKEGYNPENQYLQIWIEYGIFAFIGWMILYLFFHLVGFKAYQEAMNNKHSKQHRFYAHIVLALAIGIL
jgi:O-antigen ligase